MSPLNAIMLSAVMLSVVVLSVVAPMMHSYSNFTLGKIKHFAILSDPVPEATAGIKPLTLS
jgi:hypothetical protein